jgi:hypothetical protein
LYIDWREMGGWWFDGGTLRPTEEHRERRQRAREKAGAMPRAETRVARMKLAGHTKRADGSARGASRSLIPHEERPRQRQNALGFPDHRPAPQRIECPRCHDENRIAPLTPQRLTE